MPGDRSVWRGESRATDPDLAVAQLAEQIEQDDLAGVLFFCSDRYDPEALAAALNRRFSVPMLGCTTAGEIGNRYVTDSLVGVGLARSHFHLHTALLPDLGAFQHQDAAAMVDRFRADLAFSTSLNSGKMFALSLLDGLSIKEENAVAHLGTALQGVPLIGGSAGDNLHFRETRVFAEGRFHTGAGVLALIETSLPFRPFQLQHFAPSEKDLVITEADPSRRRVTEIDGGPAAQEYAEILGLEIDALSPQVFSRFPLMLQIGDDWYVRSIQKVNPDGSLDFFCAIEEGLPLTIARGEGLVKTLNAKVDSLLADLGPIQCTLGCDCILRRLEIQETGRTEEVEEALQRINFLGFSTFGEQFGSIHVNQTLTGIALGLP